MFGIYYNIHLLVSLPFVLSDGIVEDIVGLCTRMYKKAMAYYLIVLYFGVNEEH